MYRLLKRPRQDRAVDMVRVGKRLAELNMQQARWPPTCRAGRTRPDGCTVCWCSSRVHALGDTTCLYPKVTCVPAARHCRAASWPRHALQPRVRQGSLEFPILVCSGRRRGRRSRC